MNAVLQSTPGGQRVARRRAIEHSLFGVLPVLVTGWLLVYVLTTKFGAVDFRQDFWTVGWRTLHGASPYSWTRSQIASGVSFPYPALAALVFAPFALLPTGLASAVFTVLCLVSVGGALRVLGVRDWRLYGVAALWPAVVSGWQTANVTLLLVLGLACAWRYRDRPVVIGILAAVLVSIKPIVFPLGIWLIATRRYAATAYALVAGAVINLLAWSIVGWSTLGSWLHLLSVQGEILYRKGYAVIALAADAGLSRQSGTLLEVAAGLIVAGGCLWIGRRGNDVRSFVLATLLMLIASPQVDLHYFALLLVPLGLTRRRLHWTWLLPMILWLCPASRANGWEASLWWIVVLGLTVDTLRPRLDPPLAPQPSA
jgi:alpha-1,2-mannosyltransferase